MSRYPCVMERGPGRPGSSSSRRSTRVPIAPPLHHELTHVALQFGDLVLAPDDPHRLGHLVGELVGFVLADPKPNQIAREL
jgi:hypothetical protein